jgi:hypothetical protein
MNSPLDHLVFATPDLQTGIEQIESLLGVPAMAGGSHPGLGTRNALLGLGPKCYLEIIGPDPDQTDFQGTRPFGIDTLEKARLVTWAARREDLKQFVQSAKARGVNLGDVIPMSRRTPEGEQLNWELTFSEDSSQGGVIPFFIDWGTTQHPAANCPVGARITQLNLKHPQPQDITRLVEVLELEVNVIDDAQPGIQVLIQSPNGEVKL